MDYNFVIDMRGDRRYEYIAKRLINLGYEVFPYGGGGGKNTVDGVDLTDSASVGFGSSVNGINSKNFIAGNEINAANPENFSTENAVNAANYKNFGDAADFRNHGNSVADVADVVYIFPPSLRLIDSEAERLIDGATVFAFTQNASTADILSKKRIKFVNVFDEEGFACKNAMITADGALMLVAENTEIVFADMKILIIGFGRVGKALAKSFKALSCKVDVLTFDGSEYAAAPLLSDGQYRSFGDLRFDEYDAAINTVPARLINKHIAARFKEDVFLLELASEPGGFDREALKKSGVNFVRATGLPAKAAPVSAGKILLESIAAHLNIRV
ncbi:MAG: hypothetical protein LBP79_03070 [Clostridiales bacterium]|jgi:dipicolinic acid synthetase A subunit|nr:hypothetical protein [Clostridiales bacterium]